MTFTGHLPTAEVSAALHAADVAAFPFTAGATTKSGALLSAFAHRLPTLVTAADPPDPELVDGETVVVAPRVRDTAAVADALGRLLDDPALRARIAAGGAALGIERTWPRIAARHQELYAAAARTTPNMSLADPHGVRDILVVDLLGGIGDLVMLLPSIHALTRRHPRAAVRVLTHAPGSVLLAADPAVVEVAPRRRATSGRRSSRSWSGAASTSSSAPPVTTASPPRSSAGCCAASPTCGADRRPTSS